MATAVAAITTVACMVAKPAMSVRSADGIGTPCIGLRPLPQPYSWNATSCQKVHRIATVKAINEAPTEATSETPDILKAAQEAWDKLEDKYAVSAVAVAGVLVLWSATGMIAAVDRLPVVPGVLELVGIGYTTWFAYRNLIFKPDREDLITKVKTTYSDIIGSS